MASKLEYLQRYMTSSGGDAEGEKKKKKKTKRTKMTNSGTRIVDADDTWQLSAPSREEIEKKWEMDVAEDEQPLVVAANGEEPVDPQDLPVYVDSDKFMDEFKGRRKQKEDGDLSPPRKKRTGRSGGEESEEASPPRRLKSEDVSPPRRHSKTAKDSSRRDSEGDVLPPRKQRRKSIGDASPLRRSGHDDASPPRRAAKNSTRGRRREDDVSPHRRSDKTQSSRSRRGEADDSSRPRRNSVLSRGKDRNDASPPRRVKKETDLSIVEAKPAVKDGDSSPPRRSHQNERNSKRVERKRRSPSRSPEVPDRQRRVDSLGRDIPPRSGRSERRSPSASMADGSRHRNRKPNKSRSRSRSRGRSFDRDVSPRRRGSREERSRSPRSRHHRDSRSPSVHRHHSSRKSTRWGSPPRKDSRRHRSHSRSLGRRRSVSPSRRSRSRSKSSKHRSSRRDSVEAKRERSPDIRGIRKTTEATADSRTDTNIKREPSKRDEVKPIKENVKGDTKEEKKAGLFTATEFEQQRKVAAKRKDVLHGADASEMGANAETVYRDKRGRKLDMLNEMVRQQEVLDGKRKREEREEYEWGTGEVQKRERQSKQELLDQMKKAPFARHEDDEELERKRRERVRAFDPINSKTFQEDLLADEGKSKRKKSKKDKKTMSKVKPKYAGPPAPPNRFGILPGYRWDGVVRGTNWEEKIMMRQNANTAVSEEAYKYAVADM